MKAGDLVAFNVKRLRTKVGMSQEKLALEAGVDRTHVSRIERKMENCTISILDKLADVMGCHIREFFEEPDGSEIPNLRSGRKPK